MRRFRRRRRPRVQWLPVPGTQINQNDAIPTRTLENHGAIEFALETANGAPTTVSAPLVVDNPIEETLGTASISVYQALALNQTNEFGWRLRRIVGDIFVGATRLSSQSVAPPAVLCQAGIIVRRVADDGTPAVAAQDQDVGNIQNISDPWVWQRNWLLSSQASLAFSSDRVLRILNEFPQVNVSYGTKHHIAIDQKTARRIGPEERLFLTFSAWELPLNQTVAGVNTGPTDDHIIIYACMPYRILGTVITAAGNRRNASR